MAQNKTGALSGQSKAPRAPNLSVLEKTVLISCIDPWKRIVECTESNRFSMEDRNNAWHQIALEYAEVSKEHGITVPRSNKQIQAFWKTEKARSRTIDSMSNSHPKLTGGGKPLQLNPETECINALVHSIQPALDMTLDNEYDSTGQYQDEDEFEQNVSDDYVEPVAYSDSDGEGETSTKDELVTEDKLTHVDQTIDLTGSEIAGGSDIPNSKSGTGAESSVAKNDHLDDESIYVDEMDEGGLVKLHEKLSEKARLKRLAERAAIRDNMINDMLSQGPSVSKNKKDSRPSKQQRIAKIKSHGNPGIKIEKMQQTLKGLQPPNTRQVENQLGNKKSANKNRISNKLAAGLKHFEALQSSYDDEPSNCPKILAEHVSTQDNDSESDSPTKNFSRSNKSSAILEKRLKKCRENCDIDDDLFIKRVKAQTKESHSQQNERLIRIEESRKQQEEIHREKMEILQKEKQYWSIKVETANLEKDFEFAKHIGGGSS